MPSKNQRPPAGPRLVGYARVSTSEQNVEMQLQALRNAGVHDDNLWFEKVSAASSRRRELDKALADAREGDTFVVWKLDRLGRSLLDLIARMKDLEDRKVNFKSITEGIDTKTPAGKLIFHVIGALAQFERDLVVERTKAGVAAFKARGGVVGQPRKLSDADILAIMKQIEKKVSVREIAKQYGVAPGTVYNALKGTLSTLRGKAKRQAKRST